MNKLFTIDPKVLELDDSRVKSLKNGEITQLEFMKLITPSDPFELRGGVLRYFSPEEIKDMSEQYFKNNLALIKKSGGLPAKFFVDNKDIILSVYPELKKSMAGFKDMVLNGCTGCKNNGADRMGELLAVIPRDGRDITSLKPLLAEYPWAELFLTKSTLTDDDIKAITPPFFRRNNIAPVAIPKAESSKIAQQSDYTADRKQCLNCGRLHVARALILLRESEKGYPEHIKLAYKHMKLAEPDVPADKVEEFKVTMQYFVDELDVNDMGTISLIHKARAYLEDYLSDPLNPSQLKLWLAMGHMAEAEDEMINDYPELANMIRNERKRLEVDSTYVPDMNDILDKLANTLPRNGGQP